MSSEPMRASGRSQQQRILACVLCSQRKVKCDRQLPCSNCVKFRAVCVPAILTPRQKRRRLTDRNPELLDRIRTYEDLLRRNNISFDPMRGPTARDNESLHEDDADDSDEADVSDPHNGRRVRESVRSQEHPAEHIRKVQGCRYRQRLTIGTRWNDARDRYQESMGTVH